MPLISGVLFTYSPFKEKVRSLSQTSTSNVIMRKVSKILRTFISYMSFEKEICCKTYLLPNTNFKVLHIAHIYLQWPIQHHHHFTNTLKNLSVPSHHFEEPLVNPVSDFSGLWPWVSKPGWIHHRLYSALACAHYQSHL